MRWTGRLPRGWCIVLDLEPIKERLAEWDRFGGCQECALDGDVADLVAEVERLNEVVAAMDREHAELIAFLVSVPSSMQCACGRTVTLDVGSD
jgi:hypothetical protein